MFGEHAAFIIPSYVITAVALVTLTLWIWLTWCRRKAELAQLEAEKPVQDKN
ncbi:MAG: heme exporter protein CcmD [Pseudomonadota bacterium]